MADNNNIHTMAERLKDAIVSKAPQRLKSLVKTAPKKCVELITKDISLCTDNVQCLQVLLNYIPDIDHFQGYALSTHTMLTRAAQEGKLDCMSLLLDRGANVNSRNQEGETALMFACDDKHEAMFDLLIERGADIHIKGIHGTAVMMAACRNALRCLHKLVSLGASIREKNGNNETALSLACQCGHKDFVNALMTCIDTSSEGNNSREKEDVIPIDDINSVDLKGKTPLIWSCENGHTEVSEILLNHGAYINTQDVEGRTALMYATYYNHVECFKLLLNKGADLDIQCNGLSTVFSRAVRGNGEILNLLLVDGLVLCDGVLKWQHKAGILKSMNWERYFFFNFKTLRMLISYGLFDWNWCGQSYVDPLDRFISPAIRSSICPGTTYYEGLNLNISLLALAFTQGNISVLKFLLAHRYFFPEDYVWLSKKITFISPYFDPDKKVSKILDQLTLNPLSLRTWSFLTASKAISLAGPPNRRTQRVDRLPLPERVKCALKFQTNISDLCPYKWESITINQTFDSLNFRKDIAWTEDVKCHSGKCLECDGDYNSFKHFLFESKSRYR